MGSIAEEWRPVLGYEGIYEVSDKGEVRSCDRTILTSHGVRRRRLGQGIRSRVNGRGYLDFHAWNTGTARRITVHVCVAEAFHGKRPSGMEINHKDGCKTNNCAGNLEFVTHAENIEHATRTGLMTSRSPTTDNLSPNAKLNSPEVAEIKALIDGGLGNEAIAKRFRVSSSCISKIRRKKRWVNT